MKRLYAAASLKQCDWTDFEQYHSGIPRLYAAASLKLVNIPGDEYDFAGGIPRLYAAASLKHVIGAEAAKAGLGIPRLYAAASLKHRRHCGGCHCRCCVFRGFMPRPH